MSQMITRCPACGTRFRVVPDQLRISQGWVRCGHCDEVFDGAQQLHEGASASPAMSEADADPVLLPDPAAPDAQPTQPPADRVDTTDAWPQDAVEAAPVAPPQEAALWLPQAPAEIPVADSVAALDLDLAECALAQGGVALEPAVPQAADMVEARAEPGAVPPAESPTVPDVAPAPMAVPEASASAPPDLSFPAQAPDTMPMPLKAPSVDDGVVVARRPIAEPMAMGASPAAVALAGGAPPAPAQADGHPSDHADVSFLREPPAEPVLPPARASRAVRGFWAALAVCAALVFLGQVAIHQRDRWAVAVPALRPLLEAACEPLGCSVQALRRIDAIVIDGSSFHVTGEGAYRLSLTLRNRATHEVALPALALALTDIAELPVVRRVLLPQDLVGAPRALGPHAEWTTSVDLQLADSAGRARVVGYRLDPFYP
jgi:predicted Zn finger-like uncharacterized protein